MKIETPPPLSAGQPSSLIYHTYVISFYSDERKRMKGAMAETAAAASAIKKKQNKTKQKKFTVFFFFFFFSLSTYSTDSAAQHQLMQVSATCNSTHMALLLLLF